MIAVPIQTENPYRVIIGPNLLADCGSYIAEIKASCTVAVISDANVAPLYKEIVSYSLKSAGFAVVSYEMVAGESNKNIKTYSAILEFLAEHKLTRTDLIVALGGGIVGDIAGFAAATYLRGIDFVQIPTTLLAMVDSSVGGKTAIDLPAGKNLVGAFHQPSVVLCDVDTLRTLPESVFTDGCAEVIKYAVLFDTPLFYKLLKDGTDFQRTEVIRSCVEWKRNVVVQDELDTGVRQLLNLGHTVGHAIEKCSKYVITHGQAISAGMVIISQIGVKLGISTQSVLKDIKAILECFGLPVSTNIDVNSLYNAILSDKKRDSNILNIIFPVSIGQCIMKKMPIEDFRKLLESVL